MAEKKKRSLLRMLGWTLFVCLCVAIGGYVVHLSTLQRAQKEQLASLQARNDQLKSVVDQIEQLDAEANRAKMLASRFLNLCRSVEDIPDFDTPYVLSRQQGFEHDAMYIPAGSHTLRIFTRWQPDPKNQEPNADSDPSHPKGELSWDVPLVPDSGYFLKVDVERRGGPVKWTLTSNNDQFETRSETLPLENYSNSGASWSSSGEVNLPNQLKQFSNAGVTAALTTPPPVKLMDATLRGRLDEQWYEIKFRVELISEGGARVSVREAQRLQTLGKANLLLPYRGDGTYELKQIGPDL